MSNCVICAKNEPFPYRCKYCGKLFCVDHRLPENHKCTSKEVTVQKGIPNSTTEMYELEGFSNKCATCGIRADMRCRNCHKVFCSEHFGPHKD